MPVKMTIQGESVHAKIWTENVESKALDQIKDTATMPFLFKHIAVMPDVHWGIGSTVGTVMATERAIIPAAVGIDAGCGMQAVKLDLSATYLEVRKDELFKLISEAVPVGHLGHSQIDSEVRKWTGWFIWDKIAANDSTNMHDKALHSKAVSQMGTLGGGNHFIEICSDEGGNAWIMLHSGSRNVGKVLAERHINEAKGLMKKMFVSLPDPNLAYLAEGTPEFDAYWDDAVWAQSYARENRNRMMRLVLGVIQDYLYRDGYQSFGDGVTILDFIDCHHNYVSREHHYGKNVLITRKGAVSAKLKERGIIPGAMGKSLSYIVEGLGNPESFHSCAHGAGRQMSRGRAKKEFTVKDLEATTEGVACRKDEGVLDEVEGAYKPIDEVIDNQSDLVKVVAALRSFVCVKG